ncbi:MAG TPA: hypothetical protein VGB89_02360 [Bacteroidota bacterium]
MTRWQRILKAVASFRTWPLLIGTLLLAFAPFIPQSHLVQKFKLFMNGSLTNPIDIFDVFYHSLGLLVFAFRFYAQRVIAEKQL